MRAAAGVGGGTLGRRVEALLGLPAGELQEALQGLLREHGPGEVAGWSDASKHANRLAHRLALLGEAGPLELLAASGVGLDVQRPSDLCTPLHLAIWHGQPAAAEALKRLGANLELANSFGETPREAEQQRDRRYVSWHQQADLLVNVSPILLRRLFRERWALHVGKELEVGATILHGSEERVVLSERASARRGAGRIDVAADVAGAVAKGQALWLEGAEVEASGEPLPAPGQGPACWEVPLTKPWLGPSVRAGCLQAQRVPAEPRLPPGADAFRKVRSGRVDTWDLTLLGHFLGEEQCRLARRLVPEPEERRLLRELKDARNRVCLHQGRTEVEPGVVEATAQLLQRACEVLLPSSSGEIRALIEEARSRTVVPEAMLELMERQLDEERGRARAMQDCVDSVARFRRHLPPGAFADAAPAQGACPEAASEWSATRARSAWEPAAERRVCRAVGELLGALELPPRCDAAVVAQCVALAAECPPAQTLLLVVRTASSELGQVMLEELGEPEVQRRWKERRATVAELEPGPALFEDWCRPDGVLVSGEHGRVLRVTAQFRPPEAAARVRGPALNMALAVACAAEAVVVVSEGGAVSATATPQARRGEYLRLPAGADSEDEALSICRGAETATEAATEAGGSTARKVGELFWPHMRRREQLARALLPQAAEQVRHWSSSEAPLAAADAGLVAENTAKWLWTFICAERPLAELGPELQRALESCEVVLARLRAAGLQAQEPRLLVPMGEAQRILGRVPAALTLLHRARKLGVEHLDFEDGFSAHHMLFNAYLRLGRLGEARAMLLGARLLLDKEESSAREGLGMAELLRAKRVFLRSNEARLDGKLALESREPEALRRVQELLHETVEAMTEMRGSSLLGNTERNMAELLCLLSLVAWARGDTDCVRWSLERELPLRRTRAQEGEAVSTLVNLGRVCLGAGDVDTAEAYLSEAEDTLQGLEGAPADPQGFVFAFAAAKREVLWLLAECAERRGDPAKALAQLRRLQEMLPASVDDGSVAAAVARLSRRGPARADPDARSLEELAAFVEVLACWSTPASQASRQVRGGVAGAGGATRSAERSGRMLHLSP